MTTTVHQSLLNLFENHAPNTNQFDQTLYQQVLSDLVREQEEYLTHRKLQQQQQQEQEEQHDHRLNNILFDLELVPKLIILLRTNYSALRVLCVKCMDQMIQYWCEYDNKFLPDHSTLISYVQILCDISIYEEKVSVRQHVARCLATLSRIILQFCEIPLTNNTTISKYTSPLYGKVLAMFFAMCEDEFVQVSQIALQELNSASSSGIVMTELICDHCNYIRQYVIEGTCMKMIDKYSNDNEKKSLPLSHHELTMYIKALTRMASMDLLRSFIIDSSSNDSVVQFLKMISKIVTIRDTELSQALESLFRVYNQHVYVLRELCTFLEQQSSLEVVLENSQVINMFSRVFSVVKSRENKSSSIQEYEKLIQQVFDTFVLVGDASDLIQQHEQEYQHQYWSCIDSILQFMNHYMHLERSLPGLIINQCVLIGCIFCSRHPLTNDSVRNSAQELLQCICDSNNMGNVSALLSKRVAFILSYLQPIFKDVKNEKTVLEPLWKSTVWAKHVLQWLIPQIKYPNLNGNILESLLPMVLKLTDDFVPENKQIGLSLLYHMLEECNRLQILGFDQYIFPVIRSTMGLRDDLSQLEQAMRVMNLFLKLHSNYHPERSTDEIPSYTYRKPSQFFEEAIDEYLTCAEYAQNNEQKVLMVQYFKEFLPMMSIAFVKHMRRIFKIVFSDEFLAGEIPRPKDLIANCLNLCHLIFTMAWPVIQVYNEREKEFIGLVLQHVQSRYEMDTTRLQMMLKVEQ